MDVSKIMSENFDMILNRDKNLNKISEMATNLKDNSKKVNLYLLSNDFNNNRIYLVQERCKQVKVGILDQEVCNLDSHSLNPNILLLSKILCFLSIILAVDAGCTDSLPLSNKYHLIFN